MSILAPYFDMRQLALIEVAYEANRNSELIRRKVAKDNYLSENLDYYGEYDPEVTSARTMYVAEDNEGNEDNEDIAATRLVEIMQNIIDNKGTFVVET